MAASTTYELFQSYIASTEGNPRADRELRRLLSSADKLPEWQSPVPLMPMDEMEIRLHYIQRIENCWKQQFTYLAQSQAKRYRPLNDVEISALLVMHLDFLRSEVDKSTHSAVCLAEMVQAIPFALKICESPSRHCCLLP